MTTQFSALVIGGIISRENMPFVSSSVVSLGVVALLVRFTVPISSAATAADDAAPCGTIYVISTTCDGNFRRHAVQHAPNDLCTSAPGPNRRGSSNPGVCASHTGRFIRAAASAANDA